MKQRVNTLLEPETIEALNKEAKEKSISVSAVIRQKVEASYKEWIPDPNTHIKVSDNEYMSLSPKSDKPCDHVFNRAKGVTYTKCFKCGGEI